MVTLRRFLVVPIALLKVPAISALITRTANSARLARTPLRLAQHEVNDADSFTTKPTSPSSSMSSVSSSQHHEFQVWYRNQKVDLDALPGESVLAALERHQVFQRLGLGSEFPSACRRGNCLTCAVSTLHNQDDRLLRTDDGLSPELSRWMARRGVVLACSTYVQGPGVQLRLRDDGDAENHGLWDALYRRRLEGGAAQQAAREAAARVLRRRAERHPEEWAVSTERALRQSGDLS